MGYFTNPLGKLPSGCIHWDFTGIPLQALIQWRNKWAADNWVEARRFATNPQTDPRSLRTPSLKQGKPVTSVPLPWQNEQ